MKIVEGTFKINRIPGKGGWHYVAFPDLKAQHSETPFGWLRVKGSIDHFNIAQYNLMPMGNGHVFLPIKTEIRKVLKKKEGDVVDILLYADDSEVAIPEELAFLLQEDPEANAHFETYGRSSKKALIDWIFKAKRIETKTERLMHALEKLRAKKPLYNKQGNIKY